MKKWTSATVAGFFVLSLTGNALANDESAADIIQKSNEAMLELDSYSSETMMEMTMPDPMSGESVTISVDTKEDVTLNPFAMHQVTMMSTPDGDMETTLYWTEEGMYEQGPDGEWYLYEELSSEEMMSLLQASATQEQAEMLGEHMSVSEEGGAYVLTYEGDGEELNEMINDMLGEMMGEEMEGEAMLEGFEISNLDYDMTISQDTHYMTAMSMHMTMMIDDGEESVEMDISMEQTITNFNNVDPIVVPDEVKDNAEAIDGGSGGELPDTATNNLLYAAGGLTLAVGAFGLSLVHRFRLRRVNQ
ncbi:hypothetical protein JCM19045_775 [Bacillus sp. JCM 19045]|nr:hypothetical protein JCM19045_775 [Bacillus sp. JCM 19045]